MKFKLGKLTMTIGINNMITDNEEFAKFVTGSLSRYASCDWGDTYPEDAALNNEAVTNGDDRILATYVDKNHGWKIWINTEWDRSYTTILFPEEY